MIYILPTPIGNIDDISYRAVKILNSLQTIFCEDTRVTKRLISLINSKLNQNIDIDKFISLHSHNAKHLLTNIDKSIFEKDVAYISDAGMPCISDPGSFIVDYAIKNNLEYDVLPGANAALLALSASGFASKEFIFYGFLPHKSKNREVEIEKILTLPYTTIVYESPHRIEQFINELYTQEKTREIFCIKEATKLHQRMIRGDVSSIKDQFKNVNLKGEWCVVIKGVGELEKFESITTKDIMELDIPKKQKAKLLAKVTHKSVKECYNQLII